LIDEITSLADTVTWAIDLAHGGGALLIALLVNRQQRVFYVPGQVVHAASAMLATGACLRGLILMRQAVYPLSRRS
jgi:hypothetical protein